MFYKTPLSHVPLTRPPCHSLLSPGFLNISATPVTVNSLTRSGYKDPYYHVVKIVKPKSQAGPSQIPKRPKPNPFLGLG